MSNTYVYDKYDESQVTYQYLVANYYNKSQCSTLLSRKLNVANPVFTGSATGPMISCATGMFGGIVASTANLEDTVGTSALFSSLTGTSARFSSLTGTSARFTSLTSVDMTGTNARFDNLTGTNIHFSSISFIDMTGTNAQFDNLTGTNARFTSLTAVDMTGTNARFDNLTGTTTHFSAISFVDMTGTNARFDNLTGTNAAIDTLTTSKTNLKTFISNLCSTGLTGTSSTLPYNNSSTGSTGNSQGQVVLLNGSLYANGYKARGDTFDETLYTFGRGYTIVSTTVIPICCSSDGSIVYTIEPTINTILYSRDFGKTYTTTNMGGTTISQVVCSADGSFVLTNDVNTSKAMNVSRNYGITSTKVGSEIGWLSVCCSSDGRHCYASANVVSKLYASSDYGATWSLLNNSIEGVYMGLCCSSDGSVVYGFSSSPGAVYLSMNYGSSFTTFSSFGSNATAGGSNNCACSGDGSVFLCIDSSSRVWISKGFGDNFISPAVFHNRWNHVAVSMSKSGRRMIITSDRADSGYSAYDGSNVSSDGGSTWSNTRWGGAVVNDRWWGGAMSDDGAYYFTAYNYPITSGIIAHAEKIKISDPTDASSASTGAFMVSGGLSVGKALVVGTSGTFGSGITISGNSWISNMTGTNAKFTSLTGTNARFSSAWANEMTGTNARFENLTGTTARFSSGWILNATGTNLQIENFTGTTARLTSLWTSDMTGTNAQFENLTGTTARWMSLWTSDMTGTNVQFENITGTTARLMSLWTNDMTGTNAQFENLTGTTARWMSLWTSDMTGANVQFENLTGTTARWTSLWTNDMTGTNARFDNLTGINIQISSLTGTSAAFESITGTNAWMTSLTAVNMTGYLFNAITGIYLPNNRYTSGESSLLNYFEEESMVLTFSGPWGGSSPTGTAYFSILGKIATVCFPYIQEAGSGASSINVADFPTRLLPSAAQHLPLLVVSNGVQQLGELDLSGAPIIYADLNHASFSSSGNDGIPIQSVSYLL